MLGITLKPLPIFRILFMIFLCIFIGIMCIWLPIDINIHKHKITNNTQHEYFENSTDICKYYVDIHGNVIQNWCEYKNKYTGKITYDCGHNNLCLNDTDEIANIYNKYANDLFDCSSNNDNYISCQCNKDKMICYNFNGVYYKYNYCIYDKVNITNINCSNYIYAQNNKVYQTYQMQNYILMPIILISITVLILLLFVLIQFVHISNNKCDEIPYISQLRSCPIIDYPVIASPLIFLATYGVIALSVYMGIKLPPPADVVLVIETWTFFPHIMMLLILHIICIGRLVMASPNKYYSPIFTSIYFIICISIGIPLTIIYTSRPTICPESFTSADYAFVFGIMSIIFGSITYLAGLITIIMTICIKFIFFINQII